MTDPMTRAREGVRYTDTDLLDALEHYAWRVQGDYSDRERRECVVLMDGPRTIAEVARGATMREALAAAVDKARERETRPETEARE